MQNAPRRSYEWTRLSQTLLFDQRDDAPFTGSSFLLPLRFPPVADGFPGFIFNGRDNFGIPDLFRAPPLLLVGVVIQVTTLDLMVSHLNVTLDRPGAKLVYALLEDHNRFVHAVSLTTLHSGDILRGLTVSDFNLAGFPRWVGRVDPDEPQSLVMGVPRFNADKCPPGSFPMLRVGWTWTEEGKLNPLELIVAKDRVVVPGTWLTYKLVEQGTRSDLRVAREESVDLDNLYKEAGLSGAVYGDPTASEGAYIQFELRLKDRDPSPDPYSHSSDEDSSDEDMATSSVGEVEGGNDPPVEPTYKIPTLGKHGMGIVDAAELKEVGVALFTKVKAEEESQVVDAVLPDSSPFLPGRLTQCDTLCNLSSELLKQGVALVINTTQVCSDLFLPSEGQLCDRHRKVYDALVEGNYSAVYPSSVVDQREEDVMVAPSSWWVDERETDGQYHPPITGWSRSDGFTLHGKAHGGAGPTDGILTSTRRAQLQSINSHMSLVYRMRCFYPEHSQPYPIFWPYNEPVPRAPELVTLMWDLRLDLQVPGGPGSLAETTLLAVFEFPEDWLPGYDLLGMPTLPSAFEVSLLPVRSYQPLVGTLLAGGTINEDNYYDDVVIFDADHLDRARKDFPAYLSWCFQGRTDQASKKFGSHSSLFSFTHCIVGRMPNEFRDRYAAWLDIPREDLGLGAHILQKLNPPEYEMRRELAARIWDEERQELMRFGIQPAMPLVENDPDFPYTVSKASISLLPSSVQDYATYPGPGIATSPPRRTSVLGLLTPASKQVVKGEPKAVNLQALALSQELFESPPADPASTSRAHPDAYWSSGSFSTCKSGTRRLCISRNSGPSEAPQTNTPVEGRAATASPYQSPANHPSYLRYGPLAASGRKGKRPPTQVLPTPELERAAALRLSRDTPLRDPSTKHPDTPYPVLGKTGAATLRSGNSGQGGGGPPAGPPPLPQPSTGTLNQDLVRETADTPDPNVTGVPTTASGTRVYTSFTSSPQEEDSTAAWARAHPDGPHDNMLLGPMYMKRMALATENKLQHKAQSEVYKDLGLHDHLTEMLTNPTLGAVVAMLPSAYHIGGVAGHLPEFKASMNGASRLNVAKNVFYHSVLWSDPELLMRIRVKFTPRLLTVLAFAVFRGPMALHPSDIYVVPDEQLLEMLSTKFHLGGKTLPSSGMAKLSPPDYSKVAPTFTLLWEQLEHLILVFCLFFGDMYQLPLTAIVNDIKAIQRVNFGFTPIEAANLFSRTLAYHQDMFIAAFTSGDLADFKSIEDLLLDQDSNEDELLARIPVFPRLIPGSPAYTSLYQKKQDFYRRFNEDIGVRALRESAETPASKKVVPPKKASTTFGHLSECSSQSAEAHAPSLPADPVLCGGGKGKTTPPLSQVDSAAPPKPNVSTAPASRRPRFPPLSTECLGRGMYALFELQTSLVASGTMPKGKEICLRFLSHAGCSKCDRFHLKQEALSGISLSPWLKILLLAHRGYRGDKAITESTAQARLAQLMAEGSA